LLIGPKAARRHRTLAAVADAVTAGIVPDDVVLPVLRPRGTSVLHARSSCAKVGDASLAVVRGADLVVARDAGMLCSCEVHWDFPGSPQLLGEVIRALPALRWMHVARQVGDRQSTSGLREGPGGLPWWPLWAPQAARELLADAEAITFPALLERAAATARADLTDLAARLDDRSYLWRARTDLVNAATNYLTDQVRSTSDDAVTGFDSDDADESFSGSILWTDYLPTAWVAPIEQVVRAAYWYRRDDLAMWCVLGAPPECEDTAIDRAARVGLALRSFAEPAPPLDLPVATVWPVEHDHQDRPVSVSHPVLAAVPASVMAVIAVDDSAWTVPHYPVATSAAATELQVRIALAAATRSGEPVPDMAGLVGAAVAATAIAAS
jgi:hypothetical protein